MLGFFLVLQVASHEVLKAGLERHGGAGAAPGEMMRGVLDPIPIAAALLVVPVAITAQQSYFHELIEVRLGAV